LHFLFGETKAGEVLIDQNRDRLAQIGRRLTFGQQHVLAVENRELEPVAFKVRRRHDPVGFEVGAEQRQIEAGIAAICLGHAQNERMRLLTRPVRHIAGADITRENLLACHLRGGVNPVFQAAVVPVPIRPRQQLIFEQSRKSSRPEWREIHRYAGDQACPQHLPARWARHGLPLFCK
jgi:hypothetical protein